MADYYKSSGSRDRQRGGYGRGGYGGRSSYSRGRNEYRQMFKTVCSNCGKDCEVPFKPTGVKPVYCSDCFEKVGGNNRNTRRSFERPRYGDGNSQNDQNKARFEEINTKLDKILGFIQTINSEKTSISAETITKTSKEKPESETSKKKKSSK
jgi:CxxC-x17-CxxC domain-containing protein